MEAIQFFFDGLQCIGDPMALWGSWLFWVWSAGYLAPFAALAALGSTISK